MIISRYDPEHLHEDFGMDLGDIDMAAVESLGVGANFGRVAPGVVSEAHQHDETETFVIIAGHGEVIVDQQHVPAEAGVVVQIEPFETHYLHNTSDTDLLFATFYWRDAERAVRRADRGDRRGFAERPVFVFSSPTTPNGDLHIGHLSGPYLGADVFVRFQRMNGVRAWHIAGSDDFQSYVEGAARRDGTDCAATAAHYSREILQTHRLMDIGVDYYTVSNAEPGYQDGVRDFFARAAASPHVTLREDPALFDGRTGEYLYEVDVSGRCPTCGSPTGGNMCEECGEPNFCVDLGDPQSGRSDAPPVVRPLTRYSLAMHELRDDLERHHRLGKVPPRITELADRLFRRERLDVAISHPGGWGTQPTDSLVEDQVIWVWVEMAYRFLSGVQSLGRELGEDWRADAPQADWKIVHFMGFDNTFYHALFCPAMYRLAHPQWNPDIDYNLNEFYLLDLSKFSTSRRHAVWGKDILGPETVDAIRFYLCLTRPETRRTNFELASYEQYVEDVLIGRWQSWLDDLGRRLADDYDGAVPDAGVWRPEHAAFLARLGTRRAALSTALGHDGFSLNQAAAELNGIVDDALAFHEAQAFGAHVPAFRNDARTAIALEFAAAKLLATCAAPLLPRFSARLCAALGLPEPTSWPTRVTLLEPGSRPELTGQVFFRARRSDAERAPGGPDEVAAAVSPHEDWLCGLVAQTVNRADDGTIRTARLAELGVTSLQAIALQYQVLDKLMVDVPIEDLLGGRTVAELALHLDALAAESPLEAAADERVSLV